MQFDIDSPESVRCWLEGTCGIELTALQGKVMSLKVGQAETPRFAAEQIEFFNTNGYLSGPCVLSDEQIDTLKRPIDDIVKGRVDRSNKLRQPSLRSRWSHRRMVEQLTCPERAVCWVRSDRTSTASRSRVPSLLSAR